MSLPPETPYYQKMQPTAPAPPAGPGEPTAPTTPLELVLEFVRKEAAGDPYGFRFTAQEYLCRSAGGSFESAELSWDQGLMADLKAVRLAGCDPAVPQRLGERLRAFVTPLGWAQYEEQIRAARRGGQPVILTVRSAAAELYALPWELCTLKDSGQHIGELPGVLVRYEWPDTRTEPEPQRAPSGRILLAWSAAGGSVPAAEHESAIARACREIGQPFSPERDVLANVTCKRLTETLQEARADGPPIAILHLLCHGAALGSTFGLVLNSSDASEGAVLVDAGRLRQLLSPYAGMVRLVVLLACDSGNSGELANQLGSVAQTLHRAGIAAVVASRYPLSIAGAGLLVEELYQALLCRLTSVEEALLAARQRLCREADAAGRDWASIQLYARSQDGGAHRPLEFRPYRGLLAFGPEHRRFFFGRQREVAEIIADLAALTAAGKPRFLVVAGASGTGKSSLVLAVAVPSLCQDPQLRPLIMRPGAVGLWQLDEARKDAAGAPRLLIVVDQFEEVFTALVDELRAEFIRTLWTLASDPDSGVSVIVTLRVDFLGHCGDVVLDASGLRLDRVAYHEAHRVFISQLGPQELRQAIEQPAALVGLTLEPGLCDRIVADVGDQPGALPLLSYTLDLLWQRRIERRLTQSTYTELGGVGGALEQEGEKLLALMDEKQRRAARRLLVALVDLRPDSGVATRRRAPIAELTPADPERAAEFAAVLGRLVDARLLVRGDSGSQPVVEVAHEALIRRWKTLTQWLQADREKLLALAKLRAWTAEWQSFPGALLRDDQLGYAREVQRTQGDELDPGMRELIAASEAALGERRQAERRRKRAALFTPLFIAVLLLVAGALQWRELKRETAVARKAAAAEALALRLKQDKERAQLEHDRELAAKEKQFTDANIRKSRALLLLAASRTLVDRDPSAAALLLLATDKLVNEELDGELQVGLRALQHLRRPVELRGHTGPVRWVAFSPDGKKLVTASDDRTARVWAVTGGESLLTLRGHQGKVVVARFSPDGKRIVTASTDGTARVFSTDDSSEPVVLAGHRGPLTDAAFDAGSRRVVTASLDHTARIYRLDRSAPPIVLKEHTGPVTSAVFGPAHNLVLTASRDHTARIWYLADPGEEPQDGPKEVRTLHHSGAVLSARLSADGELLITAAASENTACLWSRFSPGSEPEVCLEGHTGSVLSAAFDFWGRAIVTASADRTARVWGLDGRQQDKASPVVLLGHGGPVHSAVFDHVGRHVLTTSQDGTVRLWNRNGSHGSVVLLDGRAAASSAAFSPGGTLVAAASSDHLARIWSVSWRPVIEALHAAVAKLCLTVEHRVRFFSESAADARLRYETCERNHGRIPHPLNSSEK